MADNVEITAGSGTTIATDDAGVAGHVQVVKLAVATDGSATAIPADASGLTVKQATAGNLNCTEASAAAIKTAVELIDDAVYTDGTGTPSKAIAVAGTDGTNPQIIKTDAAGELQVDVLSGTITTVSTVTTVSAVTAITNELPAGTQNIGDVDVASIAAGDNNIGNVDIVTGPTGASALQVQGTAADGIAVAGNPVRIAGKDIGGLTQDVFVTAAGLVRATPLTTTAPGDAVSNNSVFQQTNANDATGYPVAGAMAFNGTTWDRLRGTTTGLQAIGGIAHDTANAAGNSPQVAGAEAIAHGANPTAVAAADVTKLYANRAGVLFTIGGHPNVVTREYVATTARSDQAIVTVGAGTKVVVTAVQVTCDNANTVDVGVRMGFGATTLPATPADGATADGILLSHPGIAPGSGVVSGDGNGILGVGADGEDLRMTNEVPTSGSVRAVVKFYTIES